MKQGKRKSLINFCFIPDKKSAATQPKKKVSAKRHKAPLSNGKVANGVVHLSNGDDSRMGEPLLNGHHAGKRKNSERLFLCLDAPHIRETCS